MSLSIMLKHEANMGDHAEMIHVAFEYVPGETVEDLVQRLADRCGWGFPKALLDSHVIEIRVANP